jgi:alpha-D-ribose 1-methylphosphonate 5-triphosphate synthase subunit PhnG
MLFHPVRQKAAARHNRKQEQHQAESSEFFSVF